MKRVLARDALAVLLIGMPLFGCGTFPIQGQSADFLAFPKDAPPPPLPERDSGEEEPLSNGRGSEETEDEPLPAPRRLNAQPTVSPPPELLEELEEGPADGLSLDAAIDRLLSANPNLAAKYQDIPKARADVLTAGLRNDPVLFLSAVPIPYGRYSEQRPGATAYDITLVQPLDLSGKHKTNKRVAEKSIPILEAHYQDAVRLEIDRLFTVFVNILEARAEVRATRANLNHLSEALARCGEQVRQGRRPQKDCTRLSLRQARTRIALRQAEASLLHARRNLSVLLAFPADEGERLRLRGSLRDCAPPPPSPSELIEIARHSRPDLQAAHLSIDRAQAEVRREKAEIVDDFFLFFTPYQVVDLTPQGKQIASSWEMGVLIPIPSLNRNQGSIRHARVNVTQWGMEAERVEQEIIGEVRRAATEYTVSRQTVEQYERDILPNGRRRREEAYRRCAEEGKDVASFLSVQRDYDETLRAYVEVLARHRRAMLKLNTVVGQRILP